MSSVTTILPDQRDLRNSSREGRHICVLVPSAKKRKGFLYVTLRFAPSSVQFQCDRSTDSRTFSLFRAFHNAGIALRNSDSSFAAQINSSRCVLARSCDLNSLVVTCKTALVPRASAKVTRGCRYYEGRFTTPMFLRPLRAMRSGLSRTTCRRCLVSVSAGWALSQDIFR
jgi:hypothetical protein